MWVEGVLMRGMRNEGDEGGAGPWLVSWPGSAGLGLLMDSSVWDEGEMSRDE